MTMTNDDKAMERLQQALKRLNQNPVALLIMEGDADPGHVLEAADALVAVTCAETKGLKDRALTKAAKVVLKDWGRFLGNFRMMAKETQRVMEQ